MSHKRYQNPRKGYSRADRRQMRASIAFEQDLWLEDELTVTEVEAPARTDVVTLMADEPAEPVEAEQAAATTTATTAPALAPTTAPVDQPAGEPAQASSPEAARFRRVDRLLAAICRTA